jgi:tRNA A-37 threonylcarbamoyl transferase component Bud32
MQAVKDTKRATVRIGYDGRVHKTFRGPMARERFENEVRMLKYLEEKGCEFVPRLVEADPAKLYLVTTNCGARVQHISPERIKGLYAELETYGVRHEDPFDRNITYRPGDGRFCVIDFEFATLVESGEGLKQPREGEGEVVGHL